MEIISVKITSVFETGAVKAKANAVLGRFGVRGIKVCAVSYTHLDVYKRQVIRPCRKHRSSFRSRSRKQKYGRKNRNGDPAGRKRDRP